MRKIKSHGLAQRFLACHRVGNNVFRLARHLMKTKNYRTFRQRSFTDWDKARCIQNIAWVVHSPLYSSMSDNLTTPSSAIKY
jgi:hypothetical protein